MKPLPTRRLGAGLALVLAALGPVPRAAWGTPPSGAASAAVPVRACPDGVLSVRGGTAADLDDACTGGAAALAFLGRHGLDAPPRIDIEIVPRMPAGYTPDAAGCFDPARGLVLLLDYAGFVRFGRWLGRPIDRGMHRAIAAHEVAHALSACHFAMRGPSRIAGEYIAFVTMFATMDPGLREHALAVHPDAPWAETQPPTEAQYDAEPMRFGARAWRHWLAQPDPAATLRGILEGRLLHPGAATP